MTASVGVFVGGALGAVMVLTVLRRWPGRFTALALSVLTSLLLGAFYATARHNGALGAFVGFGILATAASFILAAVEFRDIPTTLTESFQLLRRVICVMAVQAALCAAFAAVGYLSISSVVVLYYKSTVS